MKLKDNVKNAGSAPGMDIGGFPDHPGRRQKNVWDLRNRRKSRARPAAAPLYNANGLAELRRVRYNSDISM